MTRIARAAAAIVVILAFAAVPLVADWCAASCEAAQSGIAEGTPPCHHAAAAAARIGTQPAPCGQAHRAIVIEVAATIMRAAGAMLASVNAPEPPPSSATLAASFDGRAAPVDSDISWSSHLPLALASALRI